jgi:hypothetical protein
MNKNQNAGDYETLILLDGIPITDHKALLDLPPGRIRSIEVENKMYILGNYIFTSIVNFISRNGDFAGLKLPKESVLGTADFPMASSGSADQVPASPATPVLNPTLLWKSIPSDSSGKINFQINDSYGDYQILIYGFDRNGIWFNGKQRFEVKPTL